MRWRELGRERFPSACRVAYGTKARIGVTAAYVEQRVARLHLLLAADQIQAFDEDSLAGFSVTAESQI